MTDTNDELLARARGHAVWLRSRPKANTTQSADLIEALALALSGRPGVTTQVDGFCPMGCGSTLFLGSGGHVTCGVLGCPNPTAVADLLLDAETDHVVRLGEASFDIQHPLRERLNGDLFRCDLHQRITALDGPPRAPGRYRVTDNWTWIPLAVGP